MPTFGDTPEALLGRNDSRNVASTCKGITSSGRGCRRAIASTRNPTGAGRRKSSVSELDGVVAVVQGKAEADFYCWQHKDQAERLAVERDTQPDDDGQMKISRPSVDLFPLYEKTSIDTLVQRLGINVGPVLDDSAKRKSKKVPTKPKPPRKTQAHDFASSASLTAPPAHRRDYKTPSRHPPKTKKPSFWASLCCVAIEEDDYVEIVRHRTRIDPSRSSARETAPARLLPTGPIQQTIPSSASIPSRNSVVTLPFRPEFRHQDAETSNLLSLIPQNLPPQTTAALLAELVKPISAHDEKGYIYIFWLTPQIKQAPTEETARSLLSTHPPQHHRRISDVMTEFSFDGSEHETRGTKTIMLKIGRASNVTRRMHEWQRQCGYALNLVRWYPYIPSSATPSPSRQPLSPERHLSQSPTPRRESDAVRKVPCVKRVERLVHLELAAQQVKRRCETCGKEHREWFEVEASQAGVKAVDDCVRRWVEWAERRVQ